MRTIILPIATFGCLLLPLTSMAQQWNYTEHNQNRNGSHKNNYQVGYISLEKRDDMYFFRVVTSNKDTCYEKELNANVDIDDSTVMISPINPLAGCEVARFLIKKDGSGGIKQVKANGDWIADHQNHDLTLKK